jgi:hypothetical protein
MANIGMKKIKYSLTIKEIKENQRSLENILRFAEDNNPNEKKCKGWCPHQTLHFPL